MKKIYKNIIIVFTIFTVIIWLLFWTWYYYKNKRDLVDYNISEKIVVKFKNDENKYLVNLNDWSYIKYNWEYKKYFPITYEDEKLFMDKKIYNKNNEYYFYYKSDKYFDMQKIYNNNNNNNNEVIYSWNYSNFQQWYWSQDWKFLIIKDWYIARMFGLFIAIKTANLTIHVVDIKSWKSKQLNIIDNNWRFLEVESILWYVE